MGGPLSLTAGDPKRYLNLQQLIGILKEEYIQYESSVGDAAQLRMLALDMVIYLPFLFFHFYIPSVITFTSSTYMYNIL